MTALGYYANASKYVMDSVELNDNYLLLLQEALTPLRFYLACRVCNKLLQNPMSPDHTACQHTVCSSCVGGKMRLKPSCGWCQGYENFKANKSVALLVKCYSKLCKYVSTSNHYSRQLDHVSGDKRTDIQTYKEKVAALLKEGCEYIPKDDQIENKNVNDASDSDNVFESLPSNSVSADQFSKKQAHESKSHNSGSEQRKLDKRRSSSTSNVTPFISNIKRTDYCIRVDQVRSVGDDVKGTAIEVKKRIKLQDKTKADKKGCGCGTATTTPGKLTCYGQRCPCYSNHNPCIDCRCRGCRNPNKYVKIEQASEDTDNDEINVE